MRLKAHAATFLMILLLFSIIHLIHLCAAQPTWNFRVELLSSELYMGERGMLRANITNMDCSVRATEPYEKEFKSIPEQELEMIEDRAKEMLEKDLIKDYDIEITYSHGVGGKVYYDAKLTISRACSGKSIQVYYGLLWFPWKKYPGRELGFRSEVNKELKAFNPIEYILQGFSPGSSTIMEFRLFVPPDISPDERTIRPFLDIRVRYPGWIDYTLEQYPTVGPFEIQPYRSFNLTITDYDGVNPIAGAKVVIRRLVYYYEVREYVTPENGTIRIHRLREGKYDVRVYWNSSTFIQESPLVHVGQHTAYDLASSKTLKTLLFNVKVNVFDLKGRPLNGAEVFLDGVKQVAEDGSTIYTFVPNGNHSLQACWMNLKLLDKWVWIGYHPTISPEIKEPLYDLVLPVDDLVVQAVDSGGAAVGANFTVIDLSGRLPELSQYSRAGLLNISQLPLREYIVKVLNCSRIFGTCAEASGRYSPGKIYKIELPIHSISFKVYSMTGIELENATIIFGPLSMKTNESGSARFSGIPEGNYPIKVLWRGVEVYKDQIMISRSKSQEIHSKVYDVAFKIKTAEGEPFTAKWLLVDSSGASYEPETPTDLISVSLIPSGPCNLTIVDENNRTTFSEMIAAEDLARMKILELPIKNLLIKVSWETGAPISGAKIFLKEFRSNRSYESITGPNGEAVLKRVLFSNYMLKVYHPRIKLAIIRKNITFSGEPIEVEAKEAQVQVRVVDWLGNPLRDAIVKLHVSGIVLGELSSGVDGVVRFSKLPLLTAYQLEVKHGPLKISKVIHPGEVLTVKLGVINLFGLMIYVSDIFSMIPYIVAVIVVCASIAAVIIYKAILARKEEF